MREDGESGIIGRDRLLEPVGPTFPFAQRLKRGAEVVLRPRPLKRHPLPGVFFECPR
jgi:hypothetical protein